MPGLAALEDWLAAAVASHYDAPQFSTETKTSAYLYLCVGFGVACGSTTSLIIASAVGDAAQVAIASAHLLWCVALFVGIAGRWSDQRVGLAWIAGSCALTFAVGAVTGFDPSLMFLLVSYALMLLCQCKRSCAEVLLCCIVITTVLDEVKLFHIPSANQHRVMIPYQFVAFYIVFVCGSITGRSCDLVQKRLASVFEETQLVSDLFYNADIGALRHALTYPVGGLFVLHTAYQRIFQGFEHLWTGDAVEGPYIAGDDSTASEGSGESNNENIVHLPSDLIAPGTPSWVQGSSCGGRTPVTARRSPHSPFDNMMPASIPTFSDLFSPVSPACGSDLQRLPKRCSVMAISIHRPSEGRESKKDAIDHYFTVAAEVITVIQARGGVVVSCLDDIVAMWGLAQQTHHVQLACDAAMDVAVTISGSRGCRWAVGVTVGQLHLLTRRGISAKTVFTGSVLNQAQGLVHLGRIIHSPILMTQGVKDEVNQKELSFQLVDIIPHDPHPRAQQNVRHLKTTNVFAVMFAQNSSGDQGLFSRVFAHFVSAQYDQCLELLAEYRETHPDAYSDIQASRIKALCVSAQEALEKGVKLFPSPYFRPIGCRWKHFEGDIALNEQGKGADAFHGGRVRTGKAPEEEGETDKHLTNDILKDIKKDARSTEDTTERSATDDLPDLFIDNNGEAYTRSEERLGSGTMGTVWLGMSQSGRLTALKYICIPSSTRRGLATDETVPQKLQAMVQEIVVLSKLEHENIVSYVGYGVIDSHLILCMEYVSGGSMEMLLNRFGGLGEQALLRFAVCLIEGLAYLHGNGVVHCDFKPANVLLLNEGVCKIADFGASLAVDVQSQEERGPIGTPTYMAPEASQGHASTESDVWSFGMTLATMIIGRNPYTEEQRAMRTWKFVHLLASDESFCPDLSPLLDGRESTAVVKSCMSRDPVSRPSCADLLRHPWVLGR